MLAYASLLVTTTDPSSVSVTTALRTVTAVWYLFGVVRVFRTVRHRFLQLLLKLRNEFIF